MCIGGILYFCQSYKESEPVISLLCHEGCDEKESTWWNPGLWKVFSFGSSAFLCSREIVDIHEKENALDIVTEDRVYHIVAESPEDARYSREFC